MESNRDEAERCLEYAEKFILEGKTDKAEKFLNKAERLFPTARAKELLERVKFTQQTGGNEGPQQRKSSSSGPTSEPSSTKKETPTAEYNKSHVEAVKKIKKSKDYYEILGVDKEASESEIRKSYKKLALLIHPDKNQAPGAQEAFKVIGNAVAILTDPEKRKQYDLYGSAEERVSHHHNQGHEHNYTRGFEADLTAEELFNLFFGGGLPNQNVYVRRQGRWQRTPDHHNHQRGEPSNYGVAMQMLPILLLILLSMMSGFFISDPIYSLQPSSKFSIQRKTMNLKVPYYVKENFHTEHQGSLRRLEMSVEEDHVQNLRQACYREKNYRETLFWKARNFGDRDLFEKAQNMRLSNCEQLQNLQGVH
ncbi:hypothetical protein ONE63_007253 [Megalurothrips usitatus]|uniref:J domain-containing protein n=1 Tax=Megalurothrips usitatus TaxID=439358 RepID=A0AAV7XWC7_9NEOP|nr:hypothetical protein ONE63_007253 [Megalurothrips usitatus]